VSPAAEGWTGGATACLVLNSIAGLFAILWLCLLVNGLMLWSSAWREFGLISILAVALGVLVLGVPGVVYLSWFLICGALSTRRKLYIGLPLLIAFLVWVALTVATFKHEFH
jgi:hypothetical protein